MRVVMATANHWGGPVTTGSQQYARQFVANDWSVAYVSDPVSPFQLLRPKSWLYNRAKFGLWARGGRRHLDGRLFAWNHLTLLPIFNAPLLRSELAVRHSLDLAVPRVPKKLAGSGFGEPDLFWLEHLVFEGLLERLPARASVYRLADDPELFPDPYPPALLRRLPAALAGVDLVVATAHRLVERAREHRDGGVLYLPNGVDYEHFAGDFPEPADLGAIPRPRALYVGSLEPWFDTELMEATARANGSASFVVIGPVRTDLRGLRDLPNVHVLGPRPYSEVPAYMGASDVGLVPFRIDEAMEAVHPIKVYEYLAAGLPVVSTDWEELRLMNAPIRRASTPAEFAAAVSASLDDPGDQGVRRAYARENSWATRFASLASALAPYLRP